jgi:hypothetical protein
VRDGRRGADEVERRNVRVVGAGVRRGGEDGDDGRGKVLLGDDSQDSIGVWLLTHVGGRLQRCPRGSGVEERRPSTVRLLHLHHHLLLVLVVGRLLNGDCSTRGGPGPRRGAAAVVIVIVEQVDEGWGGGGGGGAGWGLPTAIRRRRRGPGPGGRCCAAARGRPPGTPARRGPRRPLQAPQAASKPLGTKVEEEPVSGADVPAQEPTLRHGDGVSLKAEVREVEAQAGPPAAGAVGREARACGGAVRERRVLAHELGEEGDRVGVQTAPLEGVDRLPQDGRVQRARAQLMKEGVGGQAAARG